MVLKTEPKLNPKIFENKNPNNTGRATTLEKLPRRMRPRCFTANITKPKNLDDNDILPPKKIKQNIEKESKREIFNTKMKVFVSSSESEDDSNIFAENLDKQFEFGIQVRDNRESEVIDSLTKEPQHKRETEPYLRKFEEMEIKVLENDFKKNHPLKNKILKLIHQDSIN